MSQRVSLCMIVRNEERNLSDCLKCVADLVDEIVVVDTGSTDRTRDIARELGAKVFDLPWADDFAAARNESLRHATGDWIFWMDADDRLDEPNRRRLAQLIATLGSIDRETRPVFHMQCVCACPAHYEAGVCVGHGRLFPNDCDLRWTGRVHERLSPINGGAAPRIVATEISIIHQGYIDPSQLARKQLRNARLLEQEFLTNPDDPTILFYIARDRLHRLANYAECLRFARRSMAQDPGRALLTTVQSYALIAYCLSKMGKIAEAIEVSAQGLAYFPNDMELLFEHAYALRRTKRFDGARQCLATILATPPSAAALTTTRPDLQCKARSMLGAIHQDQGNFEAAEAEFAKVAALYPASPEALFLLGQARLFLGRRKEVPELIARLAKMTNGAYELAMLRATTCLIDRHFGESQRHLLSAIELRPDKASPWIVLSSALYQEGRDWPRCVEAHEKALAKAPDAMEVRHRLDRMRAAPRMRRPAAATPLAGDAPGFHGSILQMAEQQSSGAFSC